MACKLYSYHSDGVGFQWVERDRLNFLQRTAELLLIRRSSGRFLRKDFRIRILYRRNRHVGVRFKSLPLRASLSSLMFFSGECPRLPEGIDPSSMYLVAWDKPKIILILLGQYSLDDEPSTLSCRVSTAILAEAFLTNRPRFVPSFRCRFQLYNSSPSL
jgi:hypothetical protein